MGADDVPEGKGAVRIFGNVFFRLSAQSFNECFGRVVEDDGMDELWIEEDGITEIEAIDVFKSLEEVEVEALDEERLSLEQGSIGDRFV
jgi:hypothetical protein